MSEQQDGPGFGDALLLLVIIGCVVYLATRFAGP